MISGDKNEYYDRLQIILTPLSILLLFSGHVAYAMTVRSRSKYHDYRFTRVSIPHRVLVDTR